MAWDTATGDLAFSTGPGHQFLDVEFDPSGAVLLAASSSFIEISSDAEGGFFSISGHSGQTSELAHDISATELEAALSAVAGPIGRVRGSGTPDDPWIVPWLFDPIEVDDTGLVEGSVEVSDVRNFWAFDTRTWETLYTASTHPAVTVATITASPDGSAYAVNVGEALELRDLHTGETLRVLEGHDGPVNRTAFSPDGTTLATPSDDGTIHLWDLSTGEVLLVLETIVDVAMTVSFDATGDWLISSGWTDLRVWAIDIDRLLEVAQTRVTRSLTDAECSLHLGTDCS
jgi:WD40 repeat protein